MKLKNCLIIACVLGKPQYTIWEDEEGYEGHAPALLHAAEMMVREMAMRDVSESTRSAEQIVTTTEPAEPTSSTHTETACTPTPVVWTAYGGNNTSENEKQESSANALEGGTGKKVYAVDRMAPSILTEMTSNTEDYGLDEPDLISFTLYKKDASSTELFDKPTDSATHKHLRADVPMKDEMKTVPDKFVTEIESSDEFHKLEDAGASVKDKAEEVIEEVNEDEVWYKRWWHKLLKLLHLR